MGFLDKVDEDDLKRFKFACRALEAAVYDATVSDEIREQNAIEAKKILPKYTDLDPRRDSDFGPLNWYRVRTVANAGLAKIYEAGGNQMLSHRHRLLVFTNEPRIARERLFPEFYQKAFSEKCQEEVAWYRRELREIDSTDYPAIAAEIDAKKHLSGITLSSGYIPSAAIQAVNNSPRILSKKTSPERLKENDIQYLEKAIAEQTDRACKKLAERMLIAL